MRRRIRWSRGPLSCYQTILVGLTVGLSCSPAAPPFTPPAPASNGSQAISTDLLICGFSENRFGTSRAGPPSYLTPQGHIHLGARIPLEVSGSTSTLRTLQWVIEPKVKSSVTHESRVSTSRSGARLVGTRLSSADFDYTFAFARAALLDGSKNGLWRPVEQIVVDPVTDEQA